MLIIENLTLIFRMYFELQLFQLANICNKSPVSDDFLLKILQASFIMFSAGADKLPSGVDFQSSFLAVFEALKKKTILIEVL